MSSNDFDHVFFQKVLDTIFLDNQHVCTLIDFVTEMVVPTGDSYTSNIKRAYLTYKNETGKMQEVPIILKTQVRGSMVEDWTLELDFFQTEILMFSEILPKFKKYLNITLSSKCYVSSFKPDFCLVLEDLRPLGYEMLDRKTGFDMVHTKGVLKKLAELHAGSVVLTHKNGVTFDHFTKGLFNDGKLTVEWMTNSLESLARACKSLPSCVKYGEKLEKLGIPNAIKRILKSTERCHGGFNVLNHGDMWCNNMLFLHNSDGQLINTRLIDFQLSKYTSPALDLHYFYATSLMNDVRSQRDKVLDYYYSQLIGNIVKFGHSLRDIPSRKELEDDFNNRAFYGVIGLAAVAPLVKASPHKDANFQKLNEEETPGSFREFIYSCNDYLKSVEQLMPIYDSFGIFD